MASPFVHGLRGWCVTVGIVLASAYAADPKEPPSPIGLTQEQVITRYGEPKSQIVAGNRVVMFFARDRLVLVDGVVTEVERLPSEPPPRRPGAAPDSATPSPPAERTGAAGAVPPTTAPTPS